MEEKEENKGEGCVIWGAFIIFFGLGAFLILWNTYRIAKNNDQVQLVEEKALKVNFSKYDPSLDGELVLLAGPISTENIFRDET